MSEHSPATTFSQFRDKYCHDDSVVNATIGDNEVEATNLFLYGQLSDDKRIVIMRSGLHEGRIFHWMATFSAEANEEVVYEPMTDIQSSRETTDHRIAAVHGMNAAIMSVENIKATDGGHSVNVHLSSNTMRWHDNNGEQFIEMPPFDTPTS